MQAALFLLVAVLFEWCASFDGRDWAMDVFGGACIFPSVGADDTEEVSISKKCPSQALQLGCAHKRPCVDVEAEPALEVFSSAAPKKQKTTSFLQAIVARPAKSAKYMRPEEAGMLKAVTAENPKVALTTTPTSTESNAMTCEIATSEDLSLLERAKKFVEMKRKVQIRVKSVGSKGRGSRSRSSVLKSYGRSLKRSFLSGASLPAALLQVASSGRQLRRR
jgi:hypothetical protein